MDTVWLAVNVFAPVVANVVPQLNPVPLVYFSALFVVLQLGIATAVGVALDPVAFATTVFAACAPRPDSAMPPHAGAVVGPVDRIV